jgi:hypothetical protein
MVIDNNLFLNGAGELKIKKLDRDFYLDYLIDTIKDPDEMYMEYDTKKNRIIKKLLKYYKTENGAKRGMHLLFEYKKDKTIGVSAYFLKSAGTVEKKRSEKLIYKKEH